MRPFAPTESATPRLSSGFDVSHCGTNMLGFTQPHTNAPSTHLCTDRNSPLRVNSVSALTSYLATVSGVGRLPTYCVRGCCFVSRVLGRSDHCAAPPAPPPPWPDCPSSPEKFGIDMPCMCAAVMRILFVHTCWQVCHSGGGVAFRKN